MLAAALEKARKVLGSPRAVTSPEPVEARGTAPAPSQIDLSGLSDDELDRRIEEQDKRVTSAKRTASRLAIKLMGIQQAAVDSKAKRPTPDEKVAQEKSQLAHQQESEAYASLSALRRESIRRNRD
jgi:hypothetical protein